VSHHEHRRLHPVRRTKAAGESGPGRFALDAVEDFIDADPRIRRVWRRAAASASSNHEFEWRVVLEGGAVTVVIFGRDGDRRSAVTGDLHADGCRSGSRLRSICARA